TIDEGGGGSRQRLQQENLNSDGGTRQSRITGAVGHILIPDVGSGWGGQEGTRGQGYQARKPTKHLLTSPGKRNGGRGGFRFSPGFVNLTPSSPGARRVPLLVQSWVRSRSGYARTVCSTKPRCCCFCVARHSGRSKPGRGRPPRLARTRSRIAPVG